MKSPKKMKVMTIVGTRPEIIRLSRVIAQLNEYTDHVLVHTGQNYDYELNEVFFKDLELSAPKHFLNSAGSSAAETIANVIAKVDPILESEKPEAVLILGDTNSCLAAIPAKRRKIPVFHMEAGNRCFDQRVPEEINRKIVDHTADINLPYSDIARSYLIQEGIPADRVVKTGSPMAEVLEYYKRGIDGSDVLSRLGLKVREYFVVSIHREENIDFDAQLDHLVQALNEIAALYDRPVILSTHPRTRKKIESRGIRFDSRIQLLKPLGFLDYNHLQKNALAVLSDSGTITEEASILGFAGVNLRETHERPEGMEEAAVVMGGVRPERILQALELVMKQKGMTRKVADYDMPNVSHKVVRIILSYTDYVNRVIWRKN